MWCDHFSFRKRKWRSSLSGPADLLGSNWFKRSKSVVTEIGLLTGKKSAHYLWLEDLCKCIGCIFCLIAILIYTVPVVKINKIQNISTVKKWRISDFSATVELACHHNPIWRFYYFPKLLRIIEVFSHFWKVELRFGCFTYWTASELFKSQPVSIRFCFLDLRTGNLRRLES